VSSELIEGKYAVSVTRNALDNVMDGVTVHLTLNGEPVAALVPLDLAPLDGSVSVLSAARPVLGPLDAREAKLDALAAKFSPDDTAAELAERIGGEA
jgi:antitoxin (DNA-binding transcriptional repressor) of toxin-antitoxin stability system